MEDNAILASVGVKAAEALVESPALRHLLVDYPMGKHGEQCRRSGHLQQRFTVAAFLCSPTCLALNVALKRGQQVVLEDGRNWCITSHCCSLQASWDIVSKRLVNICHDLQMAITSEEINYLVYRYLQESGGPVRGWPSMCKLAGE